MSCCIWDETKTIGIYSSLCFLIKRGRYEVKCSSENFKYDSVALLSPNFEPIVLSNLDFACRRPNRNWKANRTRKLTNSFALIHHKSKPLTSPVDGFCIFQRIGGNCEREKSGIIYFFYSHAKYVHYRIRHPLLEATE